MIYTVSAYVMLAIAVLLILLSHPRQAHGLSRIAQEPRTVQGEPRWSTSRIYPFLVPLSVREQGGVAQWGSGVGLSYRTSDSDHSLFSSWVQANWRINYGHPNAVEVSWKVNLR